MAVSPLIPTSFVPRQPAEPARRTQSGANILLIISLIVFGGSVLAAGGMFAYQKYLESVANAKSEKVAEAEKRIDEDTVEGFVRLRDRLSAAHGLLDGHIALSNLLDELGKATLSSVQFDNMTLTIADDRSAKALLTGSAKSFNALAAQSAALANVPDIKRALFSDFKVDKTGVDFTLAFDAEKDAIVGNPGSASAPSTAATTTPVVMPSGATSTPAVKTTPVTQTTPTTPSTPAQTTPPATTQATPAAPPSGTAPTSSLPPSAPTP